MTKNEFNEQMTRLIKTFGEQKFPATRIAVLWDEVNDLDIAWFRALVRRMILEMNLTINIADAARGERRARAEISKTKNLLIDTVTQEESGKALKKILDKSGSNSLVDLIFKNKTSNKAGEQEQK